MGVELRKLRSTNRQLRNGHGEVKYSAGNAEAKETYMHNPWTGAVLAGLPEEGAFWVEGDKGEKIRTIVIA